VTLHYIVTVLRSIPFLDSLCKKSVTTLDELRTRAIKFMQMEKLKEFCNIATSLKKRPFDKKRSSHSQHQFKEPKHPRFNHYTPLNVNKTSILEEALGVDLISVPKKQLRPVKVDTTKHYR